MNKVARRALLAQGFTLIELLVVIVIVGIIASMAGGNFVNWVVERNSKQEALMLQEQIRILMDEAVVTQRTLALRVYPDRIQVYERGQDGWQASTQSTHKSIRVGQDMKLQLVNQDGTQPLTTSPEELTILIYLGSDGRVSPYRLRIKDQSQQCDLLSDLVGNMQITCDQST